MSGTQQDKCGQEKKLQKIIALFDNKIDSLLIPIQSKTSFLPSPYWFWPQVMRVSGDKIKTIGGKINSDYGWEITVYFLKRKSTEIDILQTICQDLNSMWFYSTFRYRTLF